MKCENQNDMQRIIDFLKKLNKMTAETGIVIHTYGDQHYDPNLADVDIEPYTVVGRVYFSYDPIQNTYVGRINNPYDGEVIFPSDYIDD